MIGDTVKITAMIPRDLADFATSCAQASHYGYESLDHVICNALRLLRQHEEGRAEFIAFVQARIKECEEGEGIPLEIVLAEMEKMINESSVKPKKYVEVELPDELAQEAEELGRINARTVGEQVEHWCRIGKIAEANPNTPYGIIYDEYGIGLEPCDTPFQNIKQGLKEAIMYEQWQNLEAMVRENSEKQHELAAQIMEEEKSLLRKIASETGRPPQAAMYLRSASTEADQKTINRQISCIQQFADHHGVAIVRRFIDEGKSGLTTKGRPGFEQMMKMISTDQADFDILLMEDVSRLGRFQDIDQHQYIESLIAKQGIQIIYCDKYG
uniref:Resolvase/invertase-type recombinase catalytic domain-containing protein n=1 Tax=Magnetococcus massalia (strain MO-1) TaxID=451514 RepID=A0A1S7LHU5_MAGMO|nr:protein of unknown function [Candidatus Magnetococcus massalia]